MDNGQFKKYENKIDKDTLNNIAEDGLFDAMDNLKMVHSLINRSLSDDGKSIKENLDPDELSTMQLVVGNALDKIQTYMYHMSGKNNQLYYLLGILKEGKTGIAENIKNIMLSDYRAVEKHYFEISKEKDRH